MSTVIYKACKVELPRYDKKGEWIRYSAKEYWEGQYFELEDGRKARYLTEDIWKNSKDLVPCVVRVTHLPRWVKFRYEVYEINPKFLYKEWRYTYKDKEYVHTSFRSYWNFGGGQARFLCYFSKV